MTALHRRAIPLQTLNQLYADTFSQLPPGLKRVPLKDKAPARRALVLAMSPRCGSTMLATLMAESGVLGLPDEYLNVGPVAHYARGLGCYDFGTYWKAVLRTRTTENGIFALKTPYNQLAPVIERRRLDTLLPDARYIYLRRADTLAQAVSLQRAISTGVWHKDRMGQPFRSGTPAEPVYDRNSIAGHIHNVERMNADWQAFFEREKIAPLRLVYEDVLADPAGALEACLRLAGVTCDKDLAQLTPRTSRVSADVSETWCARYLAETAEATPATRSRWLLPFWKARR